MTAEISPGQNSDSTPTRVVITGMGAITPLGLCVDDTWDSLSVGRSGIDYISQFDATGMRTTFAGEVRNFEPSNYMDRKEARRLDPYIQYALAATMEAVADSGIDFALEERNRVGVIVGTGIGGFHTTLTNVKVADTRGLRKISPFMIPNMLVDSAAGKIAIVYDVRGTLHLGNDPEGIFNPDPHTFMPDIWGWICVNFNIKSVLDIGCGMGTNLAWFDEYGFEVLGVEGHPKAVAASRVPGRIVQHDFSKGPWSPEREFDLCVCTEFAEHVEAEFEENWMVSLDKCKYLLLAAAPPGQGGYHHVNEQPDEYWIRRFQSRGFVWDSDITNRLRSTCTRKPAKWGRNTLMFFSRKTFQTALGK